MGTPRFNDAQGSDGRRLAGRCPRVLVAVVPAIAAVLTLLAWWAVTGEHAGLTPGDVAAVAFTEAAATILLGLGAIEVWRRLPQCRVPPAATPFREPERRDFFQAMMEAIPVAFCAKDSAGRWVYANAAIARLNDTTPDTLVGKSDFDIFPREQAERLASQDRELLATDGKLVVEEQLHTASGRTIWQLKHKSVVVLPSGERIVCTSLLDITDRKQAEIATEQGRALLDAIIEAIPDPVFVKDSASRWIAVNSAFAVLMGRPRETLIGQDDRTVLGPEVGAVREAEDRQVMASGQVLRNELAYRDPAGRDHLLAKRKAPITFPDGTLGVVGTMTDITEERRAQAEVQNARALLDAVMSAVPVPVTVKDSEGRFLFLNAAACEFFGRPLSAFIGRDDFEVFPAAHAHRARHDDDLARQSADVLAFENEFGADVAGTGRFVVKHKRGFDLPDGRRGVVAALLDVTDLHSARNAAERSERFLDAVIRAVPVPMFVKDREHRLVKVNRLQAEAVGSTVEGLLGLSDEQYVRRDLALQAYAEDDQVLRTGQRISRQHRLRTVDGEGGWRLTQKSRVTVDGADYVVGVVTDISELLAARDDAEGNRAFLDAIIDALPTPMFVKDRAHRWVIVNEAFGAIMGRSRDELIGRSDFDVLPPEFAEQAWREDDALFASKGAIVVETRTPAGRWIQKTKVAVTLRGGADYVIGSNVDIDERKVAEERLERHRDALEETVRARTAEAVAAKEAAEAANQTKSDFLANMSHELRTPMHAVLSFAKLGIDRLSSEQDGDGKLGQYFSRIHQSGSRLLALLNDLLDLSRLEAGRMNYDLRAQDLCAVVGTVLAELEAFAREREVAVDFECAQGEALAVVDGARMAQVVRNLVSNAIKFTPAGRRVRVRIDPAVDGTGSAPSPDGWLELTVTDEGIGIPPDELESVFDKFIQSSKTKSGAGGTGLGLAISREIVQQHGGTIHARNNAAGGARFVVTLPHASAASAVAGEARNVA